MSQVIYLHMDDTTSCPICNNKLRSLKLSNKYLHPIAKTANFYERTCNGTNHTLQFYTDMSTKKVDLIKVSITPTYSRFIEVDFLNQKSRIFYVIESKSECVEIPKVLELDFPDLIRLKEKISLYATFN